MSIDRRAALIGGLCYLATFITSIPALAIKTAYFAGGDRTLAALGAVLEVLLAIACVGTALALAPIVRRTSEFSATGFVASRTTEAGLILVGVLALMSVVTVREANLAEVEPPLIALHDWAFLLGPALMSALNALLLAGALFRARLVPRIIPLIGLIGAPVLLASTVGVLFGAWTQTSPVGAASALLIAAWELTLGLWLTFRGFAEKTTPGQLVRS